MILSESDKSELEHVPKQLIVNPDPKLDTEQSYDGTEVDTSRYDVFKPVKEPTEPKNVHEVYVSSDEESEAEEEEESSDNEVNMSVHHDLVNEKEQKMKLNRALNFRDVNQLLLKKKTPEQMAEYRYECPIGGRSPEILVKDYPYLFGHAKRGTKIKLRTLFTAWSEVIQYLQRSNDGQWEYCFLPEEIKKHPPIFKYPKESYVYIPRPGRKRSKKTQAGVHGEEDEPDQLELDDHIFQEREEADESENDDPRVPPNKSSWEKSDIVNKDVPSPTKRKSLPRKAKKNNRRNSRATQNKRKGGKVNEPKKPRRAKRRTSTVTAKQKKKAKHSG